MNDVTIRMGNEDDLDLFIEMTLYIRNQEVNRGRMGYVGDFKEFVKQSIVFYDGIIGDERFVVVVAEVDGEQAGIAVGEVQKLELMFDPPLQLCVHFFAVREAFRRLHVGVRMMGAMEALAYESGIRKVVCDIYQANVEVQWGLLKHGYAYENVRMTRFMDGSSMEDRKPDESDDNYSPLQMEDT